MGEYGFQDVNRAILDVASWRKLVWTANWRMGARLLGTARYYRLFHDDAYLDKHTRRLASYVTRLRAQLRGRRHLLNRERFSADVWLKVYGLHSQAVAWQGLREMASVWAETGRAGARGARTRRRVRARARATPRGAEARREGCATARSSSRSASSTASGRTAASPASRPGSYWNLVMPYALASGIFPPHGTRAKGVFQYLHAHGSRILGLVRAGAYTLYGNVRHDEVGDRSGLRAQPRTLLRGQRPARPARAQPVRAARRRDDARDVRLGRGRERLAVPRRLLPRDVPAAELREQLGVPRDAEADARPRGARAERRRARARARVRDAARVAADGQADRRARRADELRPALLHRRGEGRARSTRGSTSRSPLAARR